ncbi:MAG: hypothetical protein LAN62_07870, partial [Acidobacteriia bacterium]|nr:hypothetical protein [Terriglobia bacterium]
MDRPDRTYKPGEKITGSVVVSVGPDCQCRKITLTPTWTTRGGGIEDSASAEGQVLPGAVWHDVEEVSYPFEFRAPSGPLSHRGGDLFEIAWSLQAVADMPLGFDATAEEWFNLEHLPRLLALPILFLLGWYVYARREQIFRGDLIGWVILALITLSILSAISKIFRRAMLRRRRVAQNQLSTRPLEPGEKPPQPPGKYWEKPWATDSPR